jgi:hypothetical protein
MGCTELIAAGDGRHVRVAVLVRWPMRVRRKDYFTIVNVVPCARERSRKPVVERERERPCRSGWWMMVAAA